MNTMGTFAPTTLNNAILLLTIIVPSVYWAVQGLKKLAGK
jgi:hypothetical protein